MTRRWRTAPIVVWPYFFIPLIAVAQEGETTVAPATLPTTEVFGVAPLLGSGVDRDKVPSATRSFSARDLRREGSPNLPQMLRDRIGSVTYNETQVNPWQPDVQYRGFTASPLGGTPQGLAVYQNGVRINEAFGDTVNWDVIPDRAINRTNLIGSNPVFGLNALGGAVALEMKNGFTFQGAELEAAGGSFGRRSIEGEYGVQLGRFGAYFAANALDEDGWRDFSPSRLRRVYADLGAQLGSDRNGELHLSFTGARNTLTGNGPAPVELLTARRESIFTHPDTTMNRVGMLGLNGSYNLGDTLSVQAVTYLRRLRQRTLNGDLFDADACDPAVNPGSLCLEDSSGPLLLDQLGAAIADFLGGDVPGALNRTATTTTGTGGSVQFTETASVFGHRNHFVIGLAYDRGNVDFSASSEIGAITPNRGVATSGQVVTSADGTVAPVRLKTTTDYYGIYATDTFDLTSRLAVTLGARYNIAEIKLRDQIGTSLSESHTFWRFNPSAGATYKITQGVTAYAGYAEANRTPTPAELSCADPARPCTLANFFVSDPPLKQVVTHTYEAGFRGSFRTSAEARVNWNIGVFRTNSDDDIINVASTIQGRGFFQNAGTTRRQGVEAGLSYRDDRWSLYADYAFVDATFRDAITLNSPNNPLAGPDGTIQVTPGNTIPGIPEQRLKLGVDYRATEKWSVGGTFTYTSSQFLRGDESNLNPKIPNYAVVNLRTGYRLTPNFEVFALAQNVFDEEYATFGTFGDVTAIPFQEARVTDARMASPAQPRAIFIGARATF